MRGYYAKINVIKNKLRAKGAKNPMIIADPDTVEKCWDKDKKKDVDEGVKEVAGAVVNFAKRKAANVANFLDQEKAAAQEDGAKVRELKKNPRYTWGKGKKKEK